MPDPESCTRIEDATLFPAGVGFDNYGQPKRDIAVPLKVRWNWGRTDTLDAQGNIVSIDATAAVDRRIEIGSQIWLGSVDNVPGTNFESEANEMMTVVTYKEVSDIKGRSRRRTVGMKFSKDLLNNPA